jgi:7-cyano-7-deazaguanine reductase
MSTLPTKELEVFPNPKPSRDYTIRIESPEFTCLCPKTGQPDFATMELDRILDDLVSAIQPRYARLTAEFNVRGGIYTTVMAEHHAEGWEPPTARVH